MSTYKYFLDDRKKKKVMFEIEDRLKIVERIERGEKISVLADEYGVTVSAIDKTKKEKKDLFH